MDKVDPQHLATARKVLQRLDLRESSTPRIRPVSGHSSSIPIPCEGPNGEQFLLKFFIPPAEGKFYPAGVRIDDYARREGAFYRFLDSTDPDRVRLPAPRTVLMDPVDPPNWILLERIAGAIGPAEELLGMDQLFELLRKLQAISMERLMGRRDFPLNHWDPISYLDRIRLMYDPVLFVIGEQRWTRSQDFFNEALRWIETRPSVLVHGDFTEQNIMVDDAGQPYLLDFERLGFGNPDHDLAWFWIHTNRSQEWKRELMQRFLGQHVGSDRIRTEWGIRATLVYLAMRRLRFAYLMHGDEDPNVSANLALLDATLVGGTELFPS